ncbi:MOSC domain-containing protein [Salipaludibacillus aurantiacus]|uniref:MOSC domain-containing protein YiiM n=1 Tax=Salipaludibacillus aurantiacus TaxID=1601833 RepID=A0A1H9SJI6_9BACI|nr:MOSC domain-containing protein [Salipaludibacillus aurantiacus]SER84409.1 MOSC domain-containing protein YiiM [Salipaludibacillus aurantiacus]
MKRLKANIISLNVGTPKTLNGLGKSVETAIVKEPVDSEIFLSKEQLEGDQQADQKNHGGPDKAICVYPFDHYPFWEEELGKKLLPGAFGENLTVKGLIEEAVCIGDLFQWGEAQVQVSQPRKPCHKLAKRLESEELPKRVAETGKTGFYFRVMKEGMVSESTPLQLIKRYSEISVARVNNVYYEHQYDESLIQEVISVPELAASWKDMMRE